MKLNNVLPILIILAFFSKIGWCQSDAAVKSDKSANIFLCQKTETHDPPDVTIFNNIFNNFGNSFTGKNQFLHLSAIAATVVLVSSETDYKVYRFVNNQKNYDKYGSWFIQSYHIGGSIAFIIGGGLYLSSNITKNSELQYASCAVIQASLLTVLYISGLKALTGRANSSQGEDAKRLSKKFNFGFFRNGIFYGWPSGHAGSTMAVVSALTHFYSKSTWLKYCGYSLAVYTAFGVAVNFRGGMHWLSDGVAALLFAYAIGSTVGNHFKSLYDKKTKCSNKLKIILSPIINHKSAGFGFVYSF